MKLADVIKILESKLKPPIEWEKAELNPYLIDEVSGFYIIKAKGNPDKTEVCIYDYDEGKFDYQSKIDPLLATFIDTENLEKLTFSYNVDLEIIELIFIDNLGLTNILENWEVRIIY